MAPLTSGTEITCRGVQPHAHDPMFITEREKDWHPYYDWHHQWSDLRFRLIGQICPAPCVQAGIALHRTRKVGRYECADVEQMAFLHRLIAQALSLASVDSMGGGAMRANPPSGKQPYSVLVAPVGQARRL